MFILTAPASNWFVEAHTPAARAAGISERTLERAKKEAQADSSLRTDPATGERFWKWRVKKPYVCPLPPLEDLPDWMREQDEAERDWGD